MHRTFPELRGHSYRPRSGPGFCAIAVDWARHLSIDLLEEFRSLTRQKTASGMLLQLALLLGAIGDAMTIDEAVGIKDTES